MLTREKTPQRQRRAGYLEKRRAEGAAPRLFAVGDLADHLAAAVVAAGRAGHMAGDSAAALRAGFQRGGFPAGGALTHALAAFGLSALRIGHGGVSFGG